MSLDATAVSKKIITCVSVNHIFTYHIHRISKEVFLKKNCQQVVISSSVSNMTLFYNKSHHPNDLRLTSLNSTKVYLLWNPHSVFFLQPSEFFAYFKNDSTLNKVK